MTIPYQYPPFKTDSNGNILVSLSGTIPATTVTITDDTTTNATVYPTWVTANTGSLPVKVSSTKLTFNPSTGTLSSQILAATTLVNNVTPSTDLSVSGSVISLTAGENTVFGNIGYIKSDGKIWKADESIAGDFPAQLMATATIAANASGTYLIKGIARNDSWTWTIGGTVYLSTSGGMTQTAPSGTGNCIQVLGFALSATTVYFAPSADYITHA